MAPLGQEPIWESNRLSLLYRISQTFNSSLDLDLVLNLVIDEVIAATQAERGFLLLGTSIDRMAYPAARGLDQHTINDPEFQVSRGVIERVLQEGRPLLTSNAQIDDWLSERKSVMVLGLRSVLCVPLQLKGKTHGIIYVDNRVQSGIFSSDDLELVTSIAASAAIAIENARLYQVAIEKGRMERELQLARQVQASLLPTNPPELPGWEFAALWQPAFEAAGDFYDFIPTGEHCLGLVIADVSDKGMPSALYMAITRSIVRACINNTTTPAAAIAQANRLICADTAYGMFVTLFYSQLDASNGKLVYVNAGHNPPLLYCTKTGMLTRLTRTGMALGVEENEPYEQREIELHDGDFILYYTDGVTDAADPAGNRFGEDRVASVLYDQRSSPASQTMEALQKSLAAFTANQPPFDDITIALARRVEENTKG